MAGAERKKWKDAMAEELACIAKMDTYDLVDAPPGANVVGSVWALCKKRNEHNNVVKYKA